MKIELYYLAELPSCLFNKHFVAMKNFFATSLSSFDGETFLTLSK